MREETEEVGIHLIHDLSQLLRIVQEVEPIDIHHEHLPLILMKDEILVSLVEVSQVIERH